MKKMLNETAFYAFWQGKQYDIEANSLWDAKQKAIIQLKVPKSKLGLLAVVSKESQDNEDFKFEQRQKITNLIESTIRKILKEEYKNDYLENLLQTVDNDFTIDDIESVNKTPKGNWTIYMKGKNKGPVKLMRNIRYNSFLEKKSKETVQESIKEGNEKYRAEVTGLKENTWSTNAKEFNTEAEAKQWLDELSDRWFGYDMSRVVTTDVPRGQKVDMKNDVIYQNFR